VGKVLVVDLDKGAISIEEIPDSVYEHYLAGEGLAVYLLYKWIPPGADPLGPENVLGFIPGLLTGTGSLFSGRWSVVCKSPLTGGAFGFANCGGNFSPMIKRCGYDGIFFKGISPKPVYLFVDSGKAELRDASHVWGKDCIETEELLMEEGGLGSRVACIGPAGEKISLISGIANDGGRMAARNGVGAVMGSKRLKAVVLNGKRRIGVRNPLQMKYLSKKCSRWIKYLPSQLTDVNYWFGAFLRVSPIQTAIDGVMALTLMRKWGTITINQMSIQIGDAPVKNWKGSHLDYGHEKSKNISPDAIIEHEFEKYHCYSCPLGCGGKVFLPGKEGGHTHKPEYETTIALSAMSLNADLDSVLLMQEMLNRAGMDTISAGSVAAFAFECYEQGLLTKEDTGGLELVWGNGSAVVSLIEKMIAREGIGDILADGVKVASRRIGKGADQFAMHIGGQETAMHDGRNDPGNVVHFASEPSPGRHTNGSQLFYETFQLWKVLPDLPKIPPVYLKKVRFLADEEKWVSAAACSQYMNIANACGFCLFGIQLGAKRIPVFDWINAATGWDKSPAEYMAIAARIQTLKQAFNIKQGFDPSAVKVPERLLGLTPMEGANKGHTFDLYKMRGEYWNLFGWDSQTGRPTEAAMANLKLDELS
jgi:aldehyde:ferredoxin oxidoreductase